MFTVVPMRRRMFSWRRRSSSDMSRFSMGTTRVRMAVWECANVAVDANAAVTHQNVFEQADTPVTFNIRVKAIRDTVTVRILGKEASSTRCIGSATVDCQAPMRPQYRHHSGHGLAVRRRCCPAHKLGHRFPKVIVLTMPLASW